jgi:hypothetical protein
MTRTLSVVLLILLNGWHLLSSAADQSADFPNCEREVLQSEVSPRGDWTATSIQEVCQLGISTGASALVQLSSRSDPRLVQIVLAMTLPARAEENPRIVWSSPTQLGIVVDAGSRFGLRVAEYQGIQIEVSYCPDDPLFREALLQWQGAYRQWIRDSTAWSEARRRDPQSAGPKPAMPQPPVRSARLVQGRCLHD